MSAEAYFYFARIKSRTYIRDSGTDFAKLTRDSIKNTNLALGQNSSFCLQSTRFLRNCYAKSTAILLQMCFEIAMIIHGYVATENTF
ncbi:hypothetical protein MTR_3g415600 [Medicago truncatula]|uniref:Uncharacterized protein n=1 Tax=Medicago truncatula TaxID=3880 RepID=A0A072UUI4_MEDTR|nr:hypothetical protein MTR_3g415600 [Medicago truncatula]